MKTDIYNQSSMYWEFLKAAKLKLCNSKKKKERKETQRLLASHPMLGKSNVLTLQVSDDCGLLDSWLVHSRTVRGEVSIRLAHSLYISLLLTTTLGH